MALAGAQTELGRALVRSEPGGDLGVRAFDQQRRASDPERVRAAFDVAQETLDRLGQGLTVTCGEEFAQLVRGMPALEGGQVLSRSRRQTSSDSAFA